MGRWAAGYVEHACLFALILYAFKIAIAVFLYQGLIVYVDNAFTFERLLAANDDVKSPLTVLSSRGQRESKFTFSHRHLSRLKRGVDTSPGIFAQPPVFLDPPNNDRVSPVPSSPDISSIIPLPDKGGEPPRQDAGLPGVRVHRRTYFEYQIPANAFSNAKNGDTRSLKVSLMDCEILAEMFPNIKASCKWLTIDTDSQVLYGVPPKASTQEERKQVCDLLYSFREAAFHGRLLRF